MTDKTFTYLEMEAALCVWEELLERQGKPGNEDITQLFEGVGSSAVRASAHVIGAVVLAVHNRMTDEGYEFVGAYDWEFVPAVLQQLPIPEMVLAYQYGQKLPATDIGAIWAAVRAELESDLSKMPTWTERARAAAQRLWHYPDLVSDHPDLAAEAEAKGEDPVKFVKELGEELELHDFRSFEHGI